MLNMFPKDIQVHFIDIKPNNSTKNVNLLLALEIYLNS